MEGPSGNVAAGTAMVHSYYEPGTVEELQHSLAECFGRTGIITSGFATNGQSLWQLILETVDAFLGGSSDYYTTSPERYDIKQREMGSRTVNEAFPSLAVHLVDESGEQSEFELNSPVGIPIENDVFVGRVMVLVKPHASTSSKVDDNMMFSNRERVSIKDRKA